MNLCPNNAQGRDGYETPVDAIIWCTGFRPALDHLAPLVVIQPDGRVQVADMQAVQEPRLWLAGYGDWVAPGSATLMGAARTARVLAQKLVSHSIAAPSKPGAVDSNF